MKTDVRTTGIVLCACLSLVASNLNASCQLVPDTVLAVTRTDQRWLTYFDVVNQFDSATVMFTFGEMLVKTPISKRRIKTVTQLLPNEWKNSSIGNGVETDLRGFMKYDTVTVPPGSELRFFRKATIKNCCPENDEHEHPNGKPASWSVADDITECVLEARDAINDTVVFVADSVGIHACTNSTFSGFYGSNVSSTYHTYTIPASAYGKNVYLSIKPRKIGTSPYGMSCVPSRADVSLSVVDRGPTLGFVSKAAYDSLYAKRFTRYMQFAQANWDAYCFVPDPYMLRFSNSELDTISAHFFTDTVIGSDTLHQMKACIGDSCGTVFKEGIRSSRNKSTVLYSPILDVTAVRVVSTRVYLDVLVTGSELFMTPTAYLVNGAEVGWGEARLLPTGLTTIGIELGNVASSAIFIRLSDQHGNGLAYTKVYIR